jgi:SAM-dependent methyltransferase
MNLSSEYKRQFGWRAWPAILGALPPLRGCTVLDLGCGVGDLAAELAARGAHVIGIDMNEELLQTARSRSLANAEFRNGDLRSLPDLGLQADGIWGSFSAAYFPDLPPVLESWGRRLRPGGWIALTEIDDLFGHEPLSAQSKSCFEAYVRDSLAVGRYDFRMGRKLRGHLEKAGFTVIRAMEVEDEELSFSGPASPEVLEAWRARFDRLKLLRDFCGGGYERVCEEFLQCLARPDHRSLAKVCFCIAVHEKDAG